MSNAEKGASGVPATNGVPATIPNVPAPPRRFSLRTQLSKTYNEDDMFRWVVRTGLVISVILVAVFVICALGIHRQWKDALNILIGATSPTSIPDASYGFTLTIALIGYLVVPAFIGLIVSVLAAAMAVRRVYRRGT